MFPCKRCGKSYAYIPKLHHHKLWSCVNQTSETESWTLNLPMRNDGSNYFALPPTPEGSEGEAELVNGEEEIKEKDN